MLLDRKLNEDSKNVLKNMIRLLQMGFTGNYVPDCKRWKLQKNCKRTN